MNRLLSISLISIIILSHVLAVTYKNLIFLALPAKNPKQAYAEQRSYVEAVKASFSSSYEVKLEEAGWLSLWEVARSMLARRIVDSSRLHLTSDELSFFVNLPKPITPSVPARS